MHIRGEIAEASPPQATLLQDKLSARSRPANAGPALKGRLEGTVCTTYKRNRLLSVWNGRVFRALSGLIAFTLLLRAMIPVGFMPDLAAARDGVFTFVICSGSGFSTITLDANGDPVEPGSGHDAEAVSPCLFAPIGPALPASHPSGSLAQAGFSLLASWSPVLAAGHLRYRPTALRPRAPPLRA